MHIEVNGTRLWFDVDGPVLVTDGSRMLQRPTVILVHGGPGTDDHSYFKSDLAAPIFQAQLVYLDLRDHGRSERHVARDWNPELCADDLRAFSDALGIVRPVVLGHSLGGAVAMLYGARHPGHAGALVLQSAMARFDLDRIVDGFRRVAGDLVAELARRDYGGDSVADEEWASVFAAFGPRVPDTEQTPPEDGQSRTPGVRNDGPSRARCRRPTVRHHLSDACVRGPARSSDSGGRRRRNSHCAPARHRTAARDRRSRPLPVARLR